MEEGGGHEGKAKAEEYFKSMDSGNILASIEIPAWSRTSCIALGKLLNLSLSQSPHLQNRNNKSIYLRRYRRLCKVYLASRALTQFNIHVRSSFWFYEKDLISVYVFE